MVRFSPTLSSVAKWLCIVLLFATAGCENALKAEQTPTRVIVDFLKAVGRGNNEAAGAFVVEQNRGEIPNWVKQLFFPDHATPPNKKEEEDIDRFIGLFYRITPAQEPKATDTSVDVRMVFSATDAMVGFPSMANNPMVPNSALFMVKMTRKIEGEGRDRKVSDWQIVSIAPTTERP